MALNIKDAETDRLARQLAARMDTSITDALKTALREKLDRTRPRVDAAYNTLIEIGERGRQREIISDLTDDEILGYNAHGVPA